MHDNFEREVQKKMEELNLAPSVPVWEKIELQIRPEKRKRRILVWFFLGALLLSGGIFSYQLFTNHKESSNTITGQTTTTNHPPSKANPSPTRPIETNTHQVPSSTPDNEGSTITQPVINPTSTIIGRIKKPSISFESETATILKKEKKFRSDETLPVERNVDPKTTEDKLKETPANSNNVTAMPQGEKPSTTGSSNQSSSNDTAATVNQTTTLDSAKKTSPEKIIAPPIDSSLRKKAASNKKWKRGIFFSAGISDQVAGITKSSIVMDAIPQGSTGGIVTGGSNFNRRPADITPGLGFMVGYELSKNLSEHFEFSVGLRYAYYSTQLKVGDSRRIDTAVQFRSNSFATNQFYTNIGQSDFTNRFHTLQVPVTINYRPSLNLPLYVSAGASYGQVISTNALTYSSSSNLYYRNQDNDVRSLLPLHASVQVGLFEKAKTSMRIGPVLQYNLLKLQKENPSNTSQLFFAGLQSTINF